jgi:hypothetical protein
MDKPLYPVNAERVLGWFLIRVVTIFAERREAPAHTLAGRLLRFVARGGIGTIAVIGWLIDRLAGATVLTATRPATQI